MANTDGTDNSLFEGLFARAPVSGALEQQLKQCGYDRQRPQPKYSSAVFRECLEAARRDRHPELTPGDGLRALGHSFVADFQQTILGRVMTGALPLLGPRTLLARVPGRMQRLRADTLVTLQKLSPDEFVLEVRDRVQVGDFFAGVLEQALRVTGAVGARVTAASRPDGWAITVVLTP